MLKLVRLALVRAYTFIVLAILIVAAGIAASGIISRVHAQAQLVRCTAEQAVPTVVAAAPARFGRQSTHRLAGPDAHA
jgi:hypothetical protein